MGSSYTNSILSNDEKIEYQGGVSWAPALLYFWTVVIPFKILLAKIGDEYSITNRRAIMKSGIIFRKTLEMRLEKCEGVSLSQGLFGRMFDYGDINITGTGGSTQKFSFIKNPMMFKRTIEDVAEIRRKQLKSE